MGLSVTCLIPAWTEAARLPAVLAAVIGHPLVDEVLVVDDGSTDATAEVAAAHGAQVLRQPRNGGKAAAVAAGLARLRGDVVLMLDADLAGLTPAHVTALLHPLLAGPARATISLRANAPLPWRLIGLDYISGERAMVTASLRPHLAEMAGLRGFGLEVFLNRLWLEARLGIAVVELPAVASPSKAAKHGLWRGFLGDLRMLADIFRTVGPSTALAQIHGLRRLRLR